MNEAIKVMLARYHPQSSADYENALKEIIQEVSLLGLWRAKFFEKAAFYGGSALRILYGLNRFSEDLDFSLLKKNKNFSIMSYSRALEDELKSFGFSLTVEQKIKSGNFHIDSAFIKAGTLRNMIFIDTPRMLLRQTHAKKIMKIKLEVDIDPPLGFKAEAKYLFNPIPFSVKTFVLSDLFAGKMHAVLCRSWQNRVKGRDWYDLVWYVSCGIKLNLGHLQRRMKQSKHLTKGACLSEELFREFLREKIKVIDFSQAKKDVQYFIKDTDSLRLWTKKYFYEVCDRVKFL